VKARQEAGGRRQEEDYYTVKAGFDLICKINAANALYTKQHYIFDSFADLSEPLLIDGKHWQQGDLSCSAEIVNHNLSEFQNYTIPPHRGQPRIFLYSH
jgi:hypothetical protein